MSGKGKKLISQEIRKDDGKEAAEGTKALSQGNDEFNEMEDKFEEARAEENTFNTARAEESAARARSQRVGDMSGYATGTPNNPKEEEEEVNAEGNIKQPARNPFEGSHGWAK